MKRIFYIVAIVTVFIAATYISCSEDKDKNIEVIDVTLDRNSHQLCPGDPITLIATLDPENASNQGVKWSTDNAAVATVSGNGLSATVTAVDHGTANIIIITDDGAVRKTCRVTVVPRKYPVQSVSLAPDGQTIDQIGGTLELTAFVLPENATNPTVEFASGDEKIVTVDKNTGLVTATGCGTATVTVKTSDGGHEAEVEVTVNIAVTGVTLTSETINLELGDKRNLAVPAYGFEVLPATACNKTVTWRSDNTDVVIVDAASGNIEAVGEGIAVITVRTANSRTATCEIVVKKAPEPGDNGADFSKLKLYDFTGANRPSLFDGELKARHATMDLNYVFIAGREEYDPIYIFELADLQANSMGTPIPLNTGDVFMPTYFGRASGRYTQGHIYCANAVLGAGNVKIIHWDMANPRSNPAPEQIALVPVPARYGDNMSVNIDASGNGDIFLNGSGQVPLMRVPVTNFTTIGDPQPITPQKMGTDGIEPMDAQVGPYATFHKVDGQANEYMLAGSASPLKLVNRDAGLIYQVKSFTNNMDGCAAQIVSFNEARYLITWNGVRVEMTATNPDPDFDFVLAIYDISRGATTADALMGFDSKNEVEEDGVTVYRPEPDYSFTVKITEKSLAGGGASVHIDFAKDGDDKLYIVGSVTFGGFVIIELPAN